ncbi:MAG: oligoribonuclease [Bordetella sp.]|nr:MAG: oligoribonuclease [Bordetella sp.]
MIKDQQNLIWVDMEMTGLNPKIERIIEIAIVITDNDLNVISEGPVQVLHQNDSLLDSMDKWNKSVHKRTGLIDKVKVSKINEIQAEKTLLNFLKNYVTIGKSLLCGNTINQDRKFMSAYMPNLEKFFHYRNLDVSTIKELAKRWAPNIYKGFEKQSKHEALEDIYESINELKYYRENFFKF